MGCRLHWAREYKVDWTGGWFNYNAEVVKKLLKYLEIEVWECSYAEDDYGDFELSVDEFNKLKKILKESRKLPSYEEPIWSHDDLIEEGIYLGSNDFCPSYKNLDDWAQEVERTYDHSNSFIKFTWF